MMNFSSVFIDHIILTQIYIFPVDRKKSQSLLVICFISKGISYMQEITRGGLDLFLIFYTLQC